MPLVMVPEQHLVERFRSDLNALSAPDERIGLAVSGGPDSLALLLLAAAARPKRVEAATVDHGLRAQSGGEAVFVGEICASLEVPHAILRACWSTPPETAVQEQARNKRYRLLSYWAEERDLGAMVTAHHADDQAETFVMRLARGSGVRGLAAMRSRSIATGSHVRLLRPLLGWRRSELEQVCKSAGTVPVSDPSNVDERFERVRLRRALASADWLDPAAIARSTSYLAEADAALDWAAQLNWKNSVHEKADAIVYRPGDAPAEIARRIIGRIVRRLATEGDPELRGRELDQLLETLRSGGIATIRGVRCESRGDWRFTSAPARRH